MAVRKVRAWIKAKTPPRESPPDLPAWDETQWREFWGGHHWAAVDDAAEDFQDCERPEMAFDSDHFSPGL